MGADDFEPLTMIGKGAFGEVFYQFTLITVIKLVYNLNIFTLLYT